MGDHVCWARRGRAGNTTRTARTPPWGMLGMQTSTRPLLPPTRMRRVGRVGWSWAGGSGEVRACNAGRCRTRCNDTAVALASCPSPCDQCCQSGLSHTISHPPHRLSRAPSCFSSLAVGEAADAGQRRAQRWRRASEPTVPKPPTHPLGRRCWTAKALDGVRRIGAQRSSGEAQVHHEG